MQTLIPFLCLTLGAWSFKGEKFLTDSCRPVEKSKDFFETSLPLFFGQETPSDSRGVSSQVRMCTYFPQTTATPERQESVAVKLMTTSLPDPQEWTQEDKKRPLSFSEVMVGLMLNELEFLKEDAPKNQEMLKMFDCFYDLGAESLSLYLVLEKMSGELSPPIDGARTPFGHETFTVFKGLPVAAQISVFRDLASQLAFIHSRGKSHNDVKPNNMMLANDKASTAKIIDFGATKKSKERLVSFTPTYSDHETCRSRLGSPANDVWGFGQSLAEIVIKERVGHKAAKNLEGFKPLWWQVDHLAHQEIRRVIMARLQMSGLWTVTFEHCSFASLIFQTLRIKHKHRIAMDRVVRWLELLFSAFSGNWDTSRVLKEGEEICIGARRVVV